MSTVCVCLLRGIDNRQKKKELCTVARSSCHRGYVQGWMSGRLGIISLYRQMKGFGKDSLRIGKGSSLEEQLELVARGWFLVQSWKLAVDLDFVDARVPLSTRAGVINGAEFRGHVLAFGHLSNELVVDQDVKAVAGDANGLHDIGGLDVALEGDSADKVLERTLHEVHCTVELVAWLFSHNARLDIKASHWEH